jgi:hypothetical protein
MIALNVPRMLLCGECEQPMHLMITKRQAHCVTNECAQKSVVYQLPCEEVELVEAEGSSA